MASAISFSGLSCSIRSNRAVFPNSLSRILCLCVRVAFGGGANLSTEILQTENMCASWRRVLPPGATLAATLLPRSHRLPVRCYAP
eukprot:23971-Eustigmatos_ZCMA.PRE.1